MKFREINKSEYRILKGLNDEFGLDIGSALREKKIIVSINGRREVFVTNPFTLTLLKKLKKGVYSAGLFIGEIRKKFVLGLEGGSLIARHSKKKIFVSDRAEQLVLYGRDVFFNSILKGRKIKEGNKCLILNKNGEFIGIGQVKKGVVETLNDKGWYLRKGE